MTKTPRSQKTQLSEYPNGIHLDTVQLILGASVFQIKTESKALRRPGELDCSGIAHGHRPRTIAKNRQTQTNTDSETARNLRMLPREGDG